MQAKDRRSAGWFLLGTLQNFAHFVPFDVPACLLDCGDHMADTLNTPSGLSPRRRLESSGCERRTADMVFRIGLGSNPEYFGPGWIGWMGFWKRVARAGRPQHRGEGIGSCRSCRAASPQAINAIILPLSHPSYPSRSKLSSFDLLTVPVFTTRNRPPRRTPPSASPTRPGSGSGSS